MLILQRCWEAGSGVVIWREGENQDRDESNDRKKAINAHLSVGIFMTGSYEELDVGIMLCADSFNFTVFLPVPICLFSFCF